MAKVSESRVIAQAAGRQNHKSHHHLSFPRQEDRIRKVFALTDGTALPNVSAESLGQYYEYLLSRLALPFEAMFCQNGGEMRQLVHYVRVLGVVDPKAVHQSALYGIYCKVENSKEVLDLPLTELGVREDSSNCQLIDDYAYWFVNWR